MPVFSSQRSYLRLALILLLVLTCFAMAGLQYWRAATRGERFQREQAALLSTPVSLSAQQRERDKLLDRAATIERRIGLPARKWLRMVRPYS